MERIDDYAVLAPLLSQQLRRGVYTNHFMAPQDYPAALAEGLAVEVFDGGLWISRDRGDHVLLTFYLQQGAALPMPHCAKRAVTEVVWREGREAEAREALTQLEELGWQRLFERCRRLRPAAPSEGVGWESTAPPEAVLDFLGEHFDPLTGCLPSLERLRQQCRAGEVVTLGEGEQLWGVLHFQPGRTGSEIRHLAVAASHRGRGVATALLEEYLRRTGGAKSLVWARAGNAPAEAFYESRGYRRDGWRSAVLTVDGKDETNL